VLLLGLHWSKTWSKSSTTFKILLSAGERRAEGR
jgi:hypothetical protein